MEQNPMQKEISIIKLMIEKTRRETAQSGHLFIFIGIFSAIATLAIGMFDMYKLNHFSLPALIITAVINGIAGYVIARREEEKVTAYPKTIFWNIWVICGMAALMIVFLFPFLNVYPFSAVPALVSIIMGIALCLSGVVYELKFLQWCSLAWWVGAVLSAIAEGAPRMFIMMTVILIGWVVPGFILNKQYKKWEKENES